MRRQLLPDRRAPPALMHVLKPAAQPRPEPLRSLDGTAAQRQSSVRLDLQFQAVPKPYTYVYVFKKIVHYDHYDC